MEQAKKSMNATAHSNEEANFNELVYLTCVYIVYAVSWITCMYYLTEGAVQQASPQLSSQTSLSCHMAGQKNIHQMMPLQRLLSWLMHTQSLWKPKTVRSCYQMLQ
jgi:hypothetical protein